MDSLDDAFKKSFDDMWRPVTTRSATGTTGGSDSLDDDLAGLLRGGNNTQVEETMYPQSSLLRAIYHCCAAVQKNSHSRIEPLEQLVADQKLTIQRLQAEVASLRDTVDENTS